MNKSDYFQKLANNLNAESINSSNKAVIYTRVSTKEQEIITLPFKLKKNIVKPLQKRKD